MTPKTQAKSSNKKIIKNNYNLTSFCFKHSVSLPEKDLFSWLSEVESAQRTYYVMLKRTKNIGSRDLQLNRRDLTGLRLRTTNITGKQIVLTTKTRTGQQKLTEAILL